MIRHKVVVAAMLVNEAGEVLLQLRDDKPGLRYANRWTLFGGQVEEGESPDEAIQREMMEELALDLPLTFWKAYECPDRTIPGELIVTNHVYVGAMTMPLEMLTLHEGQAMRYFNREDSKALDLAFQQSPVLDAFFEMREQAK